MSKYKVMMCNSNKLLRTVIEASSKEEAIKLANNNYYDYSWDEIGILEEEFDAQS